MKSEYFQKYNQSSQADDGCGKCENDHKLNKDNESIIRAYITFRSMDALETIQDSYSSYTGWKRRFYMCCKCCYPEKYEHLKKKYIDGNWPEPSNAQIPDQI